jgi:hypothetical protein
MTDQYLRRVSLVVYGGSDPAQPGAEQPGINLTPDGQPPLKITFKVYQFDADTPNTAVIRIYNLSDETAQKIQTEFQQVVLQAGYEGGNFGIIFKGTIKQVRRGRRDAVDTFVDIFAADSDIAHNFAIVNTTLAPGSKVQDRADAIAKAMNPYLAEKGVTLPQDAGTGGVLPRDKVLFGLASANLTSLTDTVECSWSIQNGKVEVISRTAYKAGEAVVLNARTGLVGTPEATNNGISLTCLLNPNIKIGTRVKIDNASINQTTIREQGFPRYSDINFFASVTNDGIYRPIVVEHEGDTRGGEWYTKIICLALDPSSPASSSVKTSS